MTTRIATAIIIREIDGDTFVVDSLDPGWGIQILPTHPSDQRCHIRLVGVNTPDRNQNAKWFNPELALKASAFFAETYPPGTKVILTSYGIDSFGRTLATATAPDIQMAELQDIGNALIAAGFARTGDYPDPEPEQ